MSPALIFLVANLSVANPELNRERNSEKYSSSLVRLKQSTAITGCKVGLSRLYCQAKNLGVGVSEQSHRNVCFLFK